MGRTGPKRQPNAVLAAKGTARPTDRHDLDGEPVTTAECVPPPWLSHPYSLEEWAYLVPMLDEMGILQGTDYGVLARWCEAIKDFRLSLEGLTADDHAPGSRWWARKRDAVNELHRSGALLGLSPSDRASLGDLGVAKRKDSFEESVRKAPRVVG